MRMRLLGGVLLAAALAPHAHAAEIYAFTDARGVVHYSNVPTDPRFELLFAASDVAGGGEPARRTFMRRAAEYEPIIRAAAASARVAPELLHAVIAVESAFDPRAKSASGAVGLMQLMPATARRYGVEDRFDPEQNVRAGARYLGDLIRRYGDDLELVLAAYNAGEDAVERHGRRIPPFRETRDYVPRVLRVYRSLLESARAG